MKNDYEDFLNSACSKSWKKIGAKRRAGVTTPIFSIYSKNSIGIGEITDLKLLINWCKKTGISIIQLLPINDVGFDFRPYDAQSSMAIDPMYLSLDGLVDADLSPFAEDISTLRKAFPIKKSRVNYDIKKAKLKVLRKIFDTASNWQKSKRFQTYVKKNNRWLEDYAVFKALKDGFGLTCWEAWQEPFKRKDFKTIEKFKLEKKNDIFFYEWLQWQLFEQLRNVKSYAEEQDVFLMGDMPFLVSRDSADVWAHQEYFKLDLSSGAPPDLYFAKGQRWGMPPYNWDKIETDGFDYLKTKIKCFENLFDLYRIDHFVGLFRLWSILLSEPEENAGANGFFDPSDEAVWKNHGEKILRVMLENSKMLPCAEDLGAVPQCSYETLNEYRIPGSDVQRWMRYWGESYRFKEVCEYRLNSMAMLSTHDTSSFCAWWKYEAGTVDEWFFKKKCAELGVLFNEISNKVFDIKNSDYGRLRWKNEINSLEKFLSIIGKSENEIWALADAYKSSFSERKFYWEFVGMEGTVKVKSSLEFIEKSLRKVNLTKSIFSLQVLQDWLSLENFKEKESWQYRINTPGTMDENNWSVRSPFSLEEMQKLPSNNKIKKIVVDSGRLV